MFWIAPPAGDGRDWDYISEVKIMESLQGLIRKFLHVEGNVRAGFYFSLASGR
jgi:hypothetical protein